MAELPVKGLINIIRRGGGGGGGGEWTFYLSTKQPQHYIMYVTISYKN